MSMSVQKLDITQQQYNEERFKQDSCDELMEAKSRSLDAFTVCTLQNTIVHCVRKLHCTCRSGSTCVSDHVPGICNSIRLMLVLKFPGLQVSMFDIIPNIGRRRLQTHTAMGSSLCLHCHSLIALQW